MNLAREYDKWHERVFDSDPAHEDANTPWYELVCEYLPPLEGKSVLEIACGRGGFVRMLAGMGAWVCGGDFSHSALKIAAAKSGSGDPPGAARIALAQADAQNLPFADESFDAVITCETIEHLPNPEQALREMWRVSKPDGMLYLTTPNYMNATGLHLLYSRIAHRGRESVTDQPYDAKYTFLRVRRFLREAGWKIRCSDGIVHQFPVRRGRDPLRIEALDRNRRLRRWLRFFALHYLAICQKPARA